ncbi:MAG: DNA/RNA nuclease SfsA [Halobacteriovorax sp.]|nr:DNA/RNA nuclease SfsA [Halobacteriovorax sp.]
MKFDKPTVKGKILKRYKRFLADIELENGEIVVAHSANTGSMTTCWEPGWDVLLTKNDDPARKLKYTLEYTHNGETWIGVNTALPNKMVIEAIENGTIKELQGYDTIKPEAKIGKSRIDVLLTKDNGEQCYVEVKNTTLLHEGDAVFPDAVTERGQKHLRELTELKQQGIRACMVYVINRNDVAKFRPAGHIDAEYAKLLQQAHKVGVEIIPYMAKLEPSGLELTHSIPYLI